MVEKQTGLKSGRVSIANNAVLLAGNNSQTRTMITAGCAVLLTVCTVMLMQLAAGCCLITEFHDRAIVGVGRVSGVSHMSGVDLVQGSCMLAVIHARRHPRHRSRIQRGSEHQYQQTGEREFQHIRVIIA